MCVEIFLFFHNRKMYFKTESGPVRVDVRTIGRPQSQHSDVQKMMSYDGDDKFPWMKFVIIVAIIAVIVALIIMFMKKSSKKRVYW